MMLHIYFFLNQPVLTQDEKSKRTPYLSSISKLSA